MPRTASPTQQRGRQSVGALSRCAPPGRAAPVASQRPPERKATQRRLRAISWCRLRGATRQQARRRTRSPARRSVAGRGRVPAQPCRPRSLGTGVEPPAGCRRAGPPPHRWRRCVVRSKDIGAAVSPDHPESPPASNHAIALGRPMRPPLLPGPAASDDPAPPPTPAPDTAPRTPSRCWVVPLTRTADSMPSLPRRHASHAACVIPVAHRLPLHNCACHTSAVLCIFCTPVLCCRLPTQKPMFWRGSQLD